MVKKLLVSLSLLSTTTLFAQSSNLPDTSRAKYEVMEAEMERYFESRDGGDEHTAGEGPEYLFERWKRKIQGQLDDNGYIVPFSRTIEEWQKYRATHNNTAAKTTSSTNWILEGPTKSISNYAYIGRINVVAFDPVDSNTFYVGSPAGSTWKTTDGGAHWTVLYEHMPSNGVADIKVNPQNRNTVYVITGDYDGYATRSAGVMVSHDAGASWSTVWTSPMTYRAASLVINPADTNIMMLGTTIGVYRTTNGGVSWTNVNSRHFNQLLYNPADTAVVYGTIRGTTSNFGAQIMRSKNGGITWDSVTQFPKAIRINLAVCPADPAIVKAIVCGSPKGYQGLYSSTDSGKTYIALDSTGAACTHNLLGWDTVVTCAHQGSYDLCIAVSPTDPNKVIIGGIFTYYSQDGGSTWQMANGWGATPGVAMVHPDKHCLSYNPLTNALFEGSDGGIHKNYDPLNGQWFDLTNGISVTEFYSNAVDNGVPFCIGGTQDNGSLLLNGGLVSNLTGYDGGQTGINHGDPAHIFYTTYQGSNMFITRDAGATFKNITAGLSLWGCPTVFDLHPTDTATIVMAGNDVYVTHNNGNTWALTSPPLGANGCIRMVKIAPSNPDYIYVVKSTHAIWYTTNSGATWDSISYYSPSSNAFLSELVIDPHNEKHFWIAIGSYTYPKVYSYDLTSNTWTNQSGTLPDIPLACMVVDSTSGTLYAGSVTSIFYKTTSMPDWAPYNTNLPAIYVRDLNINYTTGELWAATYGRGMWHSLKNELPSGTHRIEQLAKHITIAPNPAHNFFTIQSMTPEFRSGDVRIKLIGTDGKPALDARGQFDNSGRIVVATSDVPPGFYICEMSNKAITVRNKVVVY